jgi:hypothetical protein
MRIRAWAALAFLQAAAGGSGAATADPPAEPTPLVTGEIRGRVLAPDGRGVPGAEVRALAHTRSAPRWGEAEADVPSARPPDADVRPAAETLSGPEGEFVLAGLAPHREFRVGARAGTTLASHEEVVQALPEARDGVALHLVEGSALALRIVGADGRGLAATVALNLWGRTYTDSQAATSHDGEWARGPEPTRPDGSLTLPAVPHGACGITVLVAERALLRRRVVTPHAGVLVLSLGDAAGARIQGVVTDAAGRPVAGARLVWGVGPHEARTLRAITTDSDGRYALEALAEGESQLLRVDAGGHALDRAEALRWSELPLRAGETVSADVRLVSGCSVSGSVRDAAGAAVAGAEVRLDPAEFELDERRTRTDAAGGYAFEDLPPLRGVVTLPGLEPLEPPRVAVDPSDPGVAFVVDVGSAGTSFVHHVRVRAADMPTLKGSVRDKQGGPVEGALVTATRLMWSRDLTPAASVRSGADGRFEIVPPAPYDKWGLQARAGTLVSTREMTSLGDQPLILTVEPERRMTFAGRLVGADGQPLAGAEVTPAAEPTTFSGVYSGPYAIRAGVTTDSQGRFRLETRPEGSGRVTLRLGHRGAWLHRLHDDELGGDDGLRWHAPGGTEDLEDLLLEALPTGGVAGNVVDESGRPVPGALVRLSLEDQGVGALRGVTVTSDLKGRFRAPYLVAGRYLVTLGGDAADDDRPAAIVPTGTSDVRVVMRTAPRPVADLRLKGTLLGPDGEPVRVARLAFTHGAQPVNGVALAVDGAFDLELAGVEPAARLLVESAFDRQGRELVAFRFEAQALEEARAGPLTVRLPSRPWLHGRVVDDTGRGVPGVLACLTELHPWGDFSFRPLECPWALTAADGAFTLDTTHRTDGRLRLLPEGDWVQPADLPISAGPEPRTIVLRRGARIAGRCLGESGEPVRASVSVRWSGPEPGELRPTETTDDGRFAAVVPRDATGVLVRADQGPRMPVRFAGVPFAQLRDVEPGRTDLVLRLGRGDVLRGTVVGPAGEPIPSGWVRLLRETGDPERELPSGFPGAAVTSAEAPTGVIREGRFEIAGLPAGERRLVAIPAGDEYAASEVVPVTVPSTDTVVSVPRSLEVALALEGGAGAVWFATWGGTSPDGLPHWRAASSDDGSHEPGILRLKLPPTGGGTLYASNQDDDRYVLVEGLSAAEPPAAPLALQAGLALEGRVEGVSADEAQGAIARVRGQGIVSSTWLLPGAQFVFRGLPPGRYELEVEVPAAFRFEVSGALPVVEAGQRDVVIRSGIRRVQRR